MGCCAAIINPYDAPYLDLHLSMLGQRGRRAQRSTHHASRDDGQYQQIITAIAQCQHKHQHKYSYRHPCRYAHPLAQQYAHNKGWQGAEHGCRAQEAEYVFKD